VAKVKEHFERLGAECVAAVTNATLNGMGGGAVYGGGGGDTGGGGAGPTIHEGVGGGAGVERGGDTPGGGECKASDR
jgi:hypothetical protein